MKNIAMIVVLALCLTLAVPPTTAHAGYSPSLYVGDTLVYRVGGESEYADETTYYWKVAEEGSGHSYTRTGNAEDYDFSVLYSSRESSDSSSESVDKFILTLNGVSIIGFAEDSQED